MLLFRSVIFMPLTTPHNQKSLAINTLKREYSARGISALCGVVGGDAERKI
jgi:hypothetical protein